MLTGNLLTVILSYGVNEVSPLLPTSEIILQYTG